MMNPGLYNREDSLIEFLKIEVRKCQTIRQDDFSAAS
jgi:hypothetical protein